MSLVTPQVVTINAVPADYHRVTTNGNQSVYKTTDGTKSLTVSHQETKTRFRRMARLDIQVVAADPLTAENSYQKASTYLVIDEPIVGFADTDLEDYVQALTAWLSSANILAMLGSRH